MENPRMKTLAAYTMAFDEAMTARILTDGRYYYWQMCLKTGASCHSHEDSLEAAKEALTRHIIEEATRRGTWKAGASLHLPT